MVYRAGARKLADMFNHLKFSNGTVASVGEIWTVNPMPKSGFTQQELDARSAKLYVR